MNIGKKIAICRARKGYSQERLAELLDISRQSVSKWEMNQAQPNVDKLLPLCDLIGIKCESLLNDEIDIDENPLKPQDGNKYFGTDGFRGEVGRILTAEHAFKVGRFLGWYFQSPLSGCKKIGYRPKIVIGKDTRRSSYTLEYALASGITASGADAYMLHVITTPGVAYVTRVDDFDCGIMITASHNSFGDNGIKVLNCNGEKFDDASTSYIESYIDGDMNALGIMDDDLPFAKKDKIGCIIDYVAGRNRYVGYLISVASHSYKNKKIALDCANGAGWMIAKSVFEALGADVYMLGNDPQGLNINLDCGSTHIEHLQKFVKEKKLDMGFAFDGDADRCIAVDDKGVVVDGDKILYVFAKRLQSRNMLDKNTVVITIMSNSGLMATFRKEGIDFEVTTVGDRFVYECMENNGYRLGGEQSGHIILRKYATTGDGILTSIMLTEEVCDTKLTLSELTKDVKLYPQKTVNVRVKDKRAVTENKRVQTVYKKINDEIGDNGRILLRESGTEPVIRVMCEFDDTEKMDKYITSLTDVIRSEGLCND